MGEVELTARDEPKKGVGVTVSLKLKLRPLETTPFRVALKVQRPGERKVLLRLRNPKSGKVWQEAVVEWGDKLNPLKVYLDRNYYMEADEASVWASAGTSREGCQRMGLRIEIILEKKSIARPKATGDEQQIILPLDSIGTGSSEVEIRLVDRNGYELGRRSCTLEKYPAPPQGTTTVQIDQYNRCLLVNGEPFFPGGICSPFFDDDHFKMWKEIGFNTVIRWSGMGRNTPIEQALKTLDVARKHRFYIFETPLFYLKHNIEHR